MVLSLRIHQKRGQLGIRYGPHTGGTYSGMDGVREGLAERKKGLGQRGNGGMGQGRGKGGE